MNEPQFYRKAITSLQTRAAFALDCRQIKHMRQGRYSNDRIRDVASRAGPKWPRVHPGTQRPGLPCVTLVLLESFLDSGWTKQ
jgi:hypothetical protein